VGKQFGFSTIRNYKDFTSQVPIRGYEEIRDQIIRMMEGQTNILWPGLVTWFAKSSGTTGDKSKFIPCTTEHLNHTHNRAGWYTLALLYHRKPDVRVFADKNLVMTGSISRTQHPDIRYGDVSAIMRHHMPWIGRPFFTPDFKTTLMPEWEEKIERMARICSKQNVGVFAGVPTWTLILIKRMLDLTGKDNMLEVWPHASAYMHGGVGFGPYEEQFRQMFPSEKFSFQEIYNASEGYFGAQDTNDRKEGLLIFPDNGIFYEFIPESQWNHPDPEAIPLNDVEISKPYAMVITTNGGLWRYKIGDTVSFTSTDPYRICITGRTRQYINTFGEEVMVDNTDRAIELTSKAMDVMVSDYSVAPIHMTIGGKGGHHWLVEFDKAPNDIEQFAEKLDKTLQELNGDYEAKRYKSMALVRLRLTVLPKGTFRKWLHKKGKAGSQAKIPRLSNDRSYLEDILHLVSLPMAEENQL
ncbi:MAG: GH3 auxin-responsive promoter family protein, partial [Saprospiraceae bacterium]